MSLQLLHPFIPHLHFGFGEHPGKADLERPSFESCLPWPLPLMGRTAPFVKDHEAEQCNTSSLSCQSSYSFLVCKHPLRPIFFSFDFLLATPCSSAQKKKKKGGGGRCTQRVTTPWPAVFPVLLSVNFLPASIFVANEDHHGIDYSKRQCILLPPY